MAEYLHFSRDSRLYMEKDGYLWSIPVLDGFSFSQATNASEVTLNEMEDSTGKSRRGRKMFTDSLSAAEWSFSTYIRPFKSAGCSGNLDGGAVGAAGAGGGSKKGIADSTANTHHAVEEALWVAMAGKNTYTATTGRWASPAAGGAISSFTLGGTTEGNGGTASTTAYTYTVSNSTLGGSTTGASTNSTNGANAVISLTLTDDGSDADVTATISERGIGWVTGDVITITGASLGGSTTADNVTLTVTSTSAAADTTDLDINFYDSSRASLGTFNLYYVFSDRSAGRLLYKLENAVVNEASIDFDIDGIATVNWSGMAGQIKEVQEDTTDASAIAAGQYHADNTSPAAPNSGSHAKGAIWIDTDDSDRFYINTAAGNNWWAAIDEGTTDTGNFIRNRLTQLTLAPESTFRSNTTFTDANGTANQQYETSYQVALTGGNVTISNNISYLTPEELGKVNQPIEHVTGTRTVTGSLTCYLGSSDVATNKVADLFKDLVADNNTVINKFAITLQVGGTATGPKVELSLPTAHLEIPSHSIEDVISVETNFHGLGSGVGEGDEMKVTYKAA